MKGVGTRLSTSIPSLPVRRLETNRGEVCRGSGTTCRPLADYSTEDNRELAAIELPIKKLRIIRILQRLMGELGKFYLDNQNPPTLNSRPATMISPSKSH